MNPTLPASLLSAALVAAAAPALAEEPVVTLEHRHVAADDAHAHADAWKRWADDFSREMRFSMGAMFAPRLGTGKLVKGAPYSASVVTESNQALADGNAITRKTRGAVYRDGKGRTRQEVPGDGKEPTVYVADPVAGRSFVLSPGSRRVVVTETPAALAIGKLKDKQIIVVNGREVRVEDGKVFVDGKQAAPGKVEVVSRGKTIRVEDGRITVDGKPLGDEPAEGKAVVDRIVVKTIDAGESGDGTRREEVRVQVLRAPDGQPAALPPPPPLPPDAAGAPPGPLPPMPPIPEMPGVQTFRFESTARLGKGVTTALGTKTLEGVKAEGKSTVWTIPAGEIGNRNPINVTSESWYSPDLQVTVYSRYSDPRTGESIYRLAGIRRGEPPADLFRVPAGYEVNERRAKGARH